MPGYPVVDALGRGMAAFYVLSIADLEIGWDTDPKDPKYSEMMGDKWKEARVVNKNNYQKLPVGTLAPMDRNNYPAPLFFRHASCLYYSLRYGEGFSMDLDGPEAIEAISSNSRSMGNKDGLFDRSGKKPLDSLLALARRNGYSGSDADFFSNEKPSVYGLALAPGYMTQVAIEYGGAILNCVFLFGLLWWLERSRERSERGTLVKGTSRKGTPVTQQGQIVVDGLVVQGYRVDDKSSPTTSPPRSPRSPHRLGSTRDVAGQPLPADGSLDPGLALHIHRLCKQYPGGVTANDNVSFSVKKAEIFALLGHNGAGKTTLIKQLTGMIPVSSGDARLARRTTTRDSSSGRGPPPTVVSKSIEDVRRYSLSVCPQDNPHWEVLTAREHLDFFARCRLGQDPSFGWNALQSQIQRYVTVLGLGEKLDCYCGNLSGGQKRRLWVVCSLLGQAPVILMDEPTSGMDPQARRNFWQMLKEIVQQEKRSVLFSTHYLEEADLLAERKVILAHGRVMAIGTSAELKRDWGVGYWVHVQAEKFTQNRLAAAENLVRVRDEIVGPILAADGTSSSNPQQTRVLTKNRTMNEYYLSYCVPWGKQHLMPQILDSLAKNKEKYKIDAFSVEMTTMDEVFTAAGEAARDRAEKVGAQGSSQAAAIMTSSNKPGGDYGGEGSTTSPKKQHPKKGSSSTIDPDLVLERYRALGLQPRNFDHELNAMIRFRFRERFGTWQRALWFGGVLVVSLALLYFLTMENFQRIPTTDDTADSGRSPMARINEKMGQAQRITFNAISLSSVFVWSFLLGGFLTINMNYERDSDSGTRRHLYMHGMKPWAFHFGNFLGFWWFPLVFHLAVGAMLMYKLQPFSTGTIQFFMSVSHTA